MEKELAESLATSLIETYLPDSTWRFGWERAVMRHGSCDHTAKVIRLSLPVTLRAEGDMVLNTILHEIAHALAGPHHGHDRVWRLHALALGADDKAASPGPDLRSEMAPWIGVCPAGHELGKRYYRKPRTPRSCAVCLPGKFSEEHIFTFTKVDIAV